MSILGVVLSLIAIAIISFIFALIVAIFAGAAIFMPVFLGFCAFFLLILAIANFIK
jgi:hypothetical protein